MSCAAISARLDHLLQALLAMAVVEEAQRLNASQLAQAHDLPHDLLQQAVRQARRAGLVEARRGCTGGRLSRPATQITLAQIVRAVDGPLLTVRRRPVDSASYLGPAQHLGEVCTGSSRCSARSSRR